jgi:hypothetical protein
MAASPIMVSQRAMAADSGANAAAETASKADLEAWRQATTSAVPTGGGCYRVDYPSGTWQKIDCGPAPADPPRTLRLNQSPGKRKTIQPNAPPLTGDWAMTPTNPISSATGSITTLTNVTSVGSINANNGSLSAGLFSLQINSEQGLAASTGSPSCPKSNSGCKGWIQFVYNNDKQLYIQYWFIRYLTSASQSCPSNLPFRAGLSCGYNAGFGMLSSSAPSDFTKMQGVVLNGKLRSNGTAVVTLTAGGTTYAVSGSNPVSAPGSTWTSAEFNVFGLGTNKKGAFNTVQFNASAEITLGLTSDNDSSGKQPGCATGSFTAENSNLFLGPCNTTSVPGIWFNESPTTPQITLTPSRGRATGGTGVQVSFGPFGQQVQIKFGNQIVSPTNTLPNDVSVSSPPGAAGSSASVTAAYIFPNGSPGPFGAPAQFSYFNTPTCNFSLSCPFYQNQPPTYTMSCPTPSDFYSTINVSVPADFNLIEQDATTNSGSTTSEVDFLATCELKSKTQCIYNSLSVPVANWCHSTGGGGGGGGGGGSKCSQCGGEKCCPDPYGGPGHVCVPSSSPCPPLQ